MKPIDEFDKIHGKYYNVCLECKKQYQKEYHQKHKLIPEYRERRLYISQDWNDKNKESRKEIDKKSRSRPEYKEKARIQKSKRYYAGLDKESILRYSKSIKGLTASKKAKRKWAKSNPVAILIKERRLVGELSGCYVVNKLRRSTGLTSETLRQYPELIDTTREILKLKRLIRERNEKSNRTQK
jgi:hypothetical protein